MPDRKKVGDDWTTPEFLKEEAEAAQVLTPDPNTVGPTIMLAPRSKFAQFVDIFETVTISIFGISGASLVAVSIGSMLFSALTPLVVPVAKIFSLSAVVAISLIWLGVRT